MTLLALALIWAGLIAFILIALNACRSHLEGEVTETPVGRIQANGFIRYRKKENR